MITIIVRWIELSAKSECFSTKMSPERNGEYVRLMATPTIFKKSNGKWGKKSEEGNEAEKKPL